MINDKFVYCQESVIILKCPSLSFANEKELINFHFIGKYEKKHTMIDR